jgi:signal transduction histidine kinase
MARQQGHWGLVGMEERAAHLGGKCQVVSKLRHGTTVSVEIPV